MTPRSIFHSRVAVTLATAVVLTASGCDKTEPVAPSTAVVAKPQNLFTNGPNTLNVYRTTRGFVFALVDFQTGLLGWVGLPTDPTQDAYCGNGGDQGYQPVPQQLAGVQQAFNRLAMSPEMNIHVYDLNTFEDTCFSPFIANGTVHMVYTDNDVTNAGPGANAFGLTLQGAVTTPGGEIFRVQGNVLLLISPIDGSFRRVTTHLSLTPVQGQ